MNNKDFEDTFEFHMSALQNITNFSDDSDSSLDKKVSNDKRDSLPTIEETLENNEFLLRTGVYSI